MGGLKSMPDVHEQLQRALQKEFPPRLVPPLSGVSGAREAEEFVKSLVEARILKVGDQLPVEDVARAMGLHRNTFAKALNNLATLGYLQRSQGRRVRVVADRPVLPDRQSSMISHAE